MLGRLRGPKSIELITTFTALTGSKERVDQLVRGLASDVWAEPEKVLFAAYTTREKQRLHGVDEYADHESFAAHLASDNGREFSTRIAEHIEGDFPHSLS